MKHHKRILHVDMDAFYASVEQQDNPQLAGKPVIIGQNPRGVVSAASYEARAYGVRSAMPVVQARKLCPQGIFLPGRMRRYVEVSAQVMAVLGDFSPLVEQASVDEAYLDITGTESLFGPPAELGAKLMAAVARRTGLSCSVGIAPVRFLAKIASDFRKPAGLTVIEPGEVALFLENLPVAKIPGVGGKFQARLALIGVTLCGQVRAFSQAFWEEKFGQAGSMLYARAHGVGSAEVVVGREVKSSSAENTFEADTADVALLERWLLRQSERVGADLRKHGLAGRTVTLKLKYADFRQITRSHTLAHPTDLDEAIFDTARKLLAQLTLTGKVRLIGVGVSNFGPADRQFSLIEDPTGQRLRKLNTAVDAIRGKHGKAAVKRGRLFEDKKKD